MSFFPFGYIIDVVSKKKKQRKSRWSPFRLSLTQTFWRWNHANRCGQLSVCVLIDVWLHNQSSPPWKTLELRWLGGRQALWLLTMEHQVKYHPRVRHVTRLPWALLHSPQKDRTTEDCSVLTLQQQTKQKKWCGGCWFRGSLQPLWAASASSGKQLASAPLLPSPLRLRLCLHVCLDGDRVNALGDEIKYRLFCPLINFSLKMAQIEPMWLRSNYRLYKQCIKFQLSTPICILSMYNSWICGACVSLILLFRCSVSLSLKCFSVLRGKCMNDQFHSEQFYPLLNKHPDNCL